jgi:hypothetical protein
MNRWLSTSLASLASLALLLSATQASAQSATTAGAPPAGSTQAAPPATPAAPLVVNAAPAEAPAPAPAKVLPQSGQTLSNGEYAAPMSQKTQPSYVPQSVAMSGPDTIDDYEEGRPVPAGYHTETRKRKGLIIGGAVTLGATYLLSAMVAAAGADLSDSGNNSVASLYVPVFGPFIQLANAGSSTGRFWCVIDGGAQAAGLAMLISGLVLDKTILVRNDLGATLIPIHTRDGGNGLGLMARF